MIRVTALLLTFWTGFAGLVYEVAWQKYLAALLGSHGEATAAVLAIFLGGLAAGYALFGWLTARVVERAKRRSRRARLLFVYALVEVGIGVYAFLFPTLFSVAQQLSLLAPGGEGLGFAFDVGLSALLIGPATVLMGGTIPILTLALAGDLGHATRVHAWVYGSNTVGAFAGALAGGYYLIPELGLDTVLYAMGCVNLVAGAIFAQLDPRAARVTPDLSEPAQGERVPRFAAWASVSGLAGFAMMALQTTFNRVGALALGASQFTFATIVAVFVLCIAIGSLAVSALPRIPRGLVVGSQWLLVLLLFPLYLAIADVTYAAHVLRVLFRAVDPAFYAYQLAVFAGLLAVLLVPIGLSGALLPLLFHALRREVGELGAVAGRLYAWNTVGSLFGALLGGYVLLFWIDLHHVFRIALGALAVGAAILTHLVLQPTPRAISVLVLLPTLAAVWLLPPWPQHRHTAGAFRWREPLAASFEGPDAFFGDRLKGSVLFYDDDPTSTVSVMEPPGQPENRGIVVNGKSDGALKGDYVTMAMSALLPALMAERRERAFVIGLGTGVTVGELAALEDTSEIEVAEISRGVIEARPFFDDGNLAASKSPKVTVRRGDAYRSLLRAEGRYDLIVSEPSNPWVSGVEMLYSREFLEAARSRLAPGGVYGQWFHLYESDVDIVALVLRTYAAVFPRVSVWFALGSDLLLLGFDRPDRALDVRALEESFARPDFAAGFARVGIESFPQLLAHELLPLGTLHATPQSGEIHTLRHPVLSYRASRAFYRGRHAWLPPYVSDQHVEVSSRNSLLRRYARDPVWTEEILEAAARETCRFDRREECAALFSRWMSDYPDSVRLQTVLAEERQKAGRGIPHIGAARLKALNGLHTGRVRVAKKGASLRQAERLTERYMRFYHHAAPFERRVLEAVWRRCRGEGCDDSRERAETVLGSLGQGRGQRAGPTAPARRERAARTGFETAPEPDDGVSRGRRLTEDLRQPTPQANPPGSRARRAE